MNKRQMCLMSIPMGTVLPEKMFNEVLEILLSDDESIKDNPAVISSEHDNEVVGLNDESHPLAEFIRAVVDKIQNS